MKRFGKRVLSLVLAAVMLLSLGVFASAEQGSYKYYFMIGDSIPIKEAQDMPNVKGNYGFRKNTYPDLIAEYFGVEKAYNGAHAGWRTQEVLCITDQSYMGDIYTSDWLHDWSDGTPETLKKAQPKYRAELEKADLITINLGNNNLLGTLAYTLARVFERETEGTRLEQAAIRAINEAMAKHSGEEAFVSLLKAAKTLGLAGILLREGLRDMAQAMRDFTGSWDALIAEVREINPEARIAVVGMYNAMQHVVDEYVPGLGILAKALTDPVVEFYNGYMRSGSPYSSEYAFADVTRIDLTGGSYDGSHPGTVGHRYMAEQIIKAIESCAHSHTVLKNAKKATGLIPGYSGDLVCAECGAVLKHGKITFYGG